MEVNMSLPKAIDLSHHLSELAKARKPSPLKSLQKYFNPGLISLAGGLPSPEYFPFSTIGATILPPDALTTASNKDTNTWSWIWNLLSREKESTVNVPKYATDSNGLDLARTLQYSPATGQPVLRKIIQEFTDKVYQPGYADYQTLMHDGNTDAWGKVLLTLCNAGDGVLMGEWTYPSAMFAMGPYNIKPVPIALDSQGICPVSLRKVLSEWDEGARGIKRPHVMYTVPVGQNPTGTTAQYARKQAIYDVCVEYDVIIVEDDPYYFLQQAPYVRRSERTKEGVTSSISDSDYFSQLAPSYANLDYQGRVIRLDSFSKVIAPGCRLGWFTCAPLFAEKLERISEVTSQAPCGFVQALVSALLLEWGSAGYMRWLKALPIQYQKRRDFMLDRFHDEFHMKPEYSVVSNNVQCEYFGFLKGPLGLDTEKELQPVFSLIPPDSGMFIWITLHFKNHPLFPEVDAHDLEMKLFEALVKSKVLFCPGWVFASNQGSDEVRSNGHFRISFSDGKDDEVHKAIEVLASSMKLFWSLRTRQQLEDF